MKSLPPVHKLVGNLTSNIYIIEYSDGIILVDCGIPLDHRLIVDRIRSLGRSPADISHILLTHYHIDHAGSAASLKRHSCAKVLAGEADVPFIEGREYQNSVRKKGILGRAVSLLPGTVKDSLANRVPPVEVERGLSDREIIELLGGIRVIHAPGHTPGSVAYLWEEQGILFTGDAIINSYRFFTLPTTGFSQDFENARISACRIIDAAEKYGVWLICPGHGPWVNSLAQKKLKAFRGRLLRGAVSPELA